MLFKVVRIKVSTTNGKARHYNVVELKVRQITVDSDGVQDCGHGRCVLNPATSIISI